MIHLRKIGVQKNEMPKQGGVILLSPTSVVLYIVFAGVHVRTSRKTNEPIEWIKQSPWEFNHHVTKAFCLILGAILYQVSIIYCLIHIHFNLNLWDDRYHVPSNLFSHRPNRMSWTIQLNRLTHSTHLVAVISHARWGMWIFADLDFFFTSWLE